MGRPCTLFRGGPLCALSSSESIPLSCCQSINFGQATGLCGNPVLIYQPLCRDSTTEQHPPWHAPSQTRQTAVCPFCAYSILLHRSMLLSPDMTGPVLYCYSFPVLHSCYSMQRDKAVFLSGLGSTTSPIGQPLLTLNLMFSPGEMMSFSIVNSVQQRLTLLACVWFVQLPDKGHLDASIHKARMHFKPGLMDIPECRLACTSQDNLKYVLIDGEMCENHRARTIRIRLPLHHIKAFSTRTNGPVSVTSLIHDVFHQSLLIKFYKLHHQSLMFATLINFLRLENKHRNHANNWHALRQ